MRRLWLLPVALMAMTACELLVGIKDKTTGQATGADSGTDPSAPCGEQPAYLFCDDFDEEAEAGETWQWDTPKGGSSIEMTTAQAKTPPRSAAFVAPPSQEASAQLGQPVGVLQSGFRLAFDLFVDEPDLSSNAQVGVAQVLANGGNFSLNYVLGPGATCQLQVYGSTSQAPILQQSLSLPPLQTWTRIVLVYDKVQGVSVIEDGDALFSSAAAAQGPPGDTEIILGAVFVNPPGSTPYQVDLDDIVMRGE
jgi:hypothetical protein